MFHHSLFPHFPAFPFVYIFSSSKVISSTYFAFQASDDELDGIQATCNDLLQTHEQLRAIVPNEQVKRRLEGEAAFIAQEWSEVYNREKARLIRGHFEDLRSSLERNIEALDKEWAEVNEQFSGQGYSADLHERYQVLVGLYWIQSLCTCIHLKAAIACGF